MIQCDANKTGLGTVLVHEDKPIAYACRALTPTECRYAQLEKDMLAITFSLTKFHQYTFGRHRHIISDHKQLRAIVKKPLDQHIYGRNGRFFLSSTKKAARNATESTGI